MTRNPIGPHRGRGRRWPIPVLLALALSAAGAPVEADSGARTMAGKPKPIKGGDVPPEVAGFNFYLPERGKEPSMVGDFDGVVAVAEIHGTGKAVQNGVEIPMSYAADMRIMTGTYVDRDGNVHQGSFGFI